MARVVHIALKVLDLEQASKFYEEVLGFRRTGEGYPKGHISRHMTDGHMDITLMKYESEDAPEATLSGTGSCIHHWGIEVEDREGLADKIRANGGTVLSRPESGVLKFRAPDGTIAELVRPGRYKTGVDTKAGH